MSTREDKISITFPVIKIEQPIGDFYLGSIEARNLYKICWVDIRRILSERDFETYLGIQRPLQDKRVKEISEYVTTIDATFPTGIILAVEERCAAVELIGEGGSRENMGLMTLSNDPEPDKEEERILFGNIAKVLDGQHRIEGLRHYKGPRFDLNVVIFVGADVPDQATIFATVNLAQTKVNRSLVYDLFALSNTRSPEKTSHEIVVALDRNEGSPFFRRIKRLGVATEGRFGETLSQATVVNMLLRYLSDNPARDRDEIKRGRKLAKTEGLETRRLIFRNMFVDSRDLEIADLIWNYFEAIKERWPAAWAATERGQILSRTNGFRAFMRFFRPCYLSLARPGEVVASDQFRRVLDGVHIDDEEFTSENFKPGTSGETELFNRLCEDTGLSE